MDRSISRGYETKQARGVGCAVAFCLLFAVVGVVLLGAMASGRSSQEELLPGLAVGGLFTLVGGGMAFAIWRGSQGKLGGGYGVSVFAARGQREAAGGIELKSNLGGQVIGLLLFALVWNGIVGSVWVASWNSGRTLPGVFLSIFLVIGLVVLGSAIWKLMQAAAPRPLLRACSHPVSVGEILELRWQFKQSSSSVERMALTLVGREEATYRRGTDSVTDKRVFMRLPIFEATGWAKIASGAVKIQIPPNTMHSFASSSNRIVWVIELQETISNWPDVNCEYAITVAPARRGA